MVCLFVYEAVVRLAPLVSLDLAGLTRVFLQVFAGALFVLNRYSCTPQSRQLWYRSDGALGTVFTTWCLWVHSIQIPGFEGIRIGAGTLRGTYPYLRLMAATC